MTSEVTVMSSLNEARSSTWPMAESLSLQTDNLSLAELFQKGLDTQKDVECGEIPSSSKEFQVSDLWTHLYSNDSG